MEIKENERISVDFAALLSRRCLHSTLEMSERKKYSNEAVSTPNSIANNLSPSWDLREGGEQTYLGNITQ